MRTIIFLSALISLIAISCHEEDLGYIEEERYEVDPFSKLTIRTLGKVYLHVASEFAVEVETHVDIIHHVDLDVRNDELTIHLRLNNREQRGLDKLDYHVYAPTYSEITLRDVADVIGRDGFEVDELTINLKDVGDIDLRDISTESILIYQDGVGDVTVDGVTVDAYYSLDDVGNIHCYGLTSENATARLSGVGDMYIHPTVTLDARITGVGNIYYKGDPSVTQTTNKTGKVIRVD